MAISNPISNPLLAAVEAGRSGLRRAARGLEAEAEAEAYRLAWKLSSGPYTTAQLRQMGHPYSKRRPRPPLPPGIVNVQSGRFRAAWRIKASLSGIRLTFDIDNTSPEARFLLRGTSRMIERPYERLLREQLSQAMPRILARWLGRPFGR